METEFGGAEFWRNWELTEENGPESSFEKSLFVTSPLKVKSFTSVIVNFGVWVTRCFKSGASETSVMWNRNVATQVGGSSRVL